MRKKYLTLILTFLLLLPALVVNAEQMQKGLRIKDVFEKYGKKKNVVMVELSKEFIETYEMSFYKSIVIKNDPEALEYVRNCLKNDQKGARKIKEITDDGGVISAFYQLASQKDEDNKFVLFKVNKKMVITLVYIEGDLESDDLITVLFSGKDL
ncbi:MAG: hypothetical protein Q4F97_04350 [Bacteroidales bacterium]|nr:hypothetical protein [Bacteroidales bacterium]